MRNFKSYQVQPNIPESLSFLETLSGNMWWCWTREAVELFRRIDPRLWAESGRNPVPFLARIPQARLEKLARDSSYTAQLERVRSQFERRVNRPEIDLDIPFGPGESIAYFSMEFGLHESLPLFAGGLGVLAGDHLKACSNVGLPLVGIGLMYRQGYFRQFLNHDGWQQEAYPDTDFYSLPLQRTRDAAGNELRVTIRGGDGPIHAVVWKIMVGRVPLLLLDTNILENPPEHREITARLYAAESRIRLAQEILLGIGGMRALQALGIKPKIVHMNEGHCGFAGLERLAQLVEEHKVDLTAALQIVPRTTVFTTHTPVAAGHDEFPPDMVRPFLRPLAERLGTTENEILSWGQSPGTNDNGPLSMFILGVRLSAHCNGVSELHGSVARRMWAHIWPGRPVEEVPITHITNGIHVPTFTSLEMGTLFERYLGPEWYLGSQRPENIKRIDEIYNEELWRAHEINRARLVRTCREHLVAQYKRRNAPRKVLESIEKTLAPDVLTIVFARRFATYKRAFLLIQDPQRLEALINHEQFPIQFIFAGKAHPRDNEGKGLVQQIYQFANRPSVRNRFVFLENYDMHLARHLLQGADVWLNTPRRPFEACGTSGMKAAINGAVNFSILDGWWCEGYRDTTGWSIGNGEEYEDHAFQDAVESQALYNILENEVVPCFYDRKNGDLPGCWLIKMKASMKMAMEKFCSLRMVMEYSEKLYTPAARWHARLTAEGGAEAARLADRMARLRTHWKGVTIDPPTREVHGPQRVGDSFEVSVEVRLGELQPEEVDVELYYGHYRSFSELTDSRVIPMQVLEERSDGFFRYGCTLVCETAGRFGFSARVTPRGDNWIKFFPGLITWAGEQPV
ncbi:MAG: alpha-glucan family phosphorylase [Desulfobacterales bacterium]